MLTRKLLTRQSRHVTRQSSSAAVAAASATKPLTKDPWVQIFDELPESTTYSSLSKARSQKKLDIQDYFTKNGNSTLHSSSKFFSRNPLGSVRSFSTSARRSYARERSSSSAGTMSGWDRVFEDLESTPFVAPTRSSAVLEQPLRSSFRRQTMTAREISAFDDMFNMLFNAVAPKDPSKQTLNSSSENPSVGYTLHKERLKKSKIWLPRPLTSEEETLLDAKKEDMELCHSDFEVLQWAEKELFMDSMERLRRFEERQVKLESFPPDPKLTLISSTSTTTSSPAEEIQNPLYGPLLTNLMNIVMHKFNNTQLACTLFQHAANLSFPSLIHACTTSSFNVYLEALWASTKDLEAVNEGLEEMFKLGVKRDNSTRNIVAKIRRDLEANLRKCPIVYSTEMDDGTLDVNTHRQIGTLEEGEIFRRLERMDTLCADDPSDIFFTVEEPVETPAWKEEWKSNAAPSNNRVRSRSKTIIDASIFDPLDKLEDLGEDIFSESTPNGKENHATSDDRWTFDDWGTIPSSVSFSGVKSGYLSSTKRKMSHAHHSLATAPSSSGQRIRSTW